MLRLFCPTLRVSLALLLTLPATSSAARQRSPSLTLESANAAELQQGKPSTPLLVKLQVLLDGLMPHLARSMALWVRTPVRQLQPILR
jgi:hypothetical protein